MRGPAPVAVPGPAEAPGVLAPLTLAGSHPALLDLLAPGMSVLDVGSGPGTLTVDIARRVAPGAVVGMDRSREMIDAAEAASPPGAVPNLVFYAGDVSASGWDGEFDLVNAARVLQWIPDAGRAVAAMARAARPGGLVVALDYDHTRAAWHRPPAAWTRFHRAFLDWRTAAGLDNAIATRLAALLGAAGLGPARVTPWAQTVRAGDPGFFAAAGRWRMMIESRGRQMVAAGVIGEDERRAALAAYTEWMQAPGAAQTCHLATAVARRPRA